MAIETTGANIALDALAATLTHAGAIDASGNEITGGTYARKAITWADADSGSVALNGTLPVFDMPAGSDIAEVGFFTALTAGTMHASDEVDAETFTNAGTYTVTSGTIAIS